MLFVEMAGAYGNGLRPAMRADGLTDEYLHV